MVDLRKKRSRKVGKRRAQAQIITVILIILIVIVGILIVWNVFRPLIARAAERISLSKLKVDLEIESAYIDDDNKTAYVAVKRGVGKANLTALKFIFTDINGKNYIYKYPLAGEIPDELESKVYNITVTGVVAQNPELVGIGFDFRDIVSVGIAFVVRTSYGGEVTSGVKDVFGDSKKEDLRRDVGLKLREMAEVFEDAPPETCAGIASCSNYAIENECNNDVCGVGVYGCEWDVGVCKDSLPAVMSEYVSWWKFDGDATDEAGLNDGTLVDGAFVYDSERDYGSGTTGEVLSLDGVGDYVTIPTSASLSNFTNESISISLWYYEVGSSTTALIEKSTGDMRNPSSTAKGFFMSETRFTIANGTANTMNTLTYSAIENQWTHVMATVDSLSAPNPQVKLYMNGILDSNITRTLGGTIDMPSIDLSIGRWAYSGQTFNGSIDDVMIFNRSLSETEILEIYCGQGGTGGSCLDLENYTWYVRPKTGEYGLENGLSYANAWDGLSSVVWGANGVNAGDTLYICGTFSQDSESSLLLLEVGASGTAGQPITIRGDCPGDPGFLIGAKSVTTGWTDNGDGTFYRTSTAFSCGAVEGILNGTEALLILRTSQAEVAAADGSFWHDIATDTLWYNPYGDITKTFWGWWQGPIRNYGNDYIKYQNLKVWFGYTIENLAISHTGDGSEASYVTVNNCSFKYTCTSLIASSGDNVMINNNIFEEFPTGIFMGDGPPNITIQGNRFNSGSFYSKASADNGAMQLQVGANWIIEENYIEKAIGWGIHLYKEPSGIVNSCLVRNNYIQNVIKNQEYGTPYGIYISGNNNLDYANRWGGLVIANNIITNLTGNFTEKGGVGIRPKVGVSLADPNKRMKVMNNVISRCNYNIDVFDGLVGGPGAGVIIQNNIGYNPSPGGYHIVVATNTTDVLMSNNLWYPDTSGGNNLFKWSSTVVANHSDFVALAVASGADVGIGDIVADPLFVSVNPQVPADFKLLFGSPAIDNGTDVGLTRDYEGNVIPQGAGPDIGAYEYVP